MSLTSWQDCKDSNARLGWLEQHRDLKLPFGAAQVSISSELDPEQFGRGVSLIRAQLGAGLEIGNEAWIGDLISEGRCRIGPRARIGTGGPVRLKNADVGADAELVSGFIEGSCILSGARLGYSSSIRPGCVIDVGAALGQSNDLKNSYLGAHTLVGSSTNFCDIAFLGGRPVSPVTQCEVGSGTIHFNFGIHGEKWGSWLGSIDGLLLDRERSFLGGNTSLIGPLLLPDGLITLVGAQLRLPWKSEKDPAPQLLYQTPPPAPVSAPFDPAIFGRISLKWRTTLKIIARYHALEAWLRLARPQLPQGLYLNRAAELIRAVVAERARWLRSILALLPESIERLGRRGESHRAEEQQVLLDRWSDPVRVARLSDFSSDLATAELQDQALSVLSDWTAKHPHETLAQALSNLPNELKNLLRRWLHKVCADLDPDANQEELL